MVMGLEETVTYLGHCAIWAETLQATGGWRRNGRKVGYMKQGDLNGDKYGAYHP